MNIFTDFHHASLLNSLIMLFEGRLESQVYRPIGMEWAEKGYWKIYDHPATQLQYLGIGGATPDGSPRLNEVTERGFIPGGGLWYCKDIDSSKENKAVNLEYFMNNDFDIVIASIPAHIAPFRKLCDSHPSHPKLIYQLGNAWNITPEDESMVDGIMASARLPNMPKKPYIEYHQEFDLSIFTPDIGELMPLYTIYSFINCFNHQGHFASDWALFQEIERAMPDWIFKSYGGSCRDGAAHGTRQLADKMREARFIWHTKAGGDGYGHIIHNAAAIGRPLITKKSYYEGKLGADLMIDGETCINIDNLTRAQIVDKIVHFSEATRYKEMRRKTYANFVKLVNFEKEAEDIRLFLQNIQ